MYFDEISHNRGGKTEEVNFLARDVFAFRTTCCIVVYTHQAVSCHPICRMGKPTQQGLRLYFTQWCERMVDPGPRAKRSIV